MENFMFCAVGLKWVKLPFHNNTPGENCCIVGWNMRKRQKDIAMLKIASEMYWVVKKWIDEVTKLRALDDKFH